MKKILTLLFISIIFLNVKAICTLTAYSFNPTSAITINSATINWNGASMETYELEFGTTGFVHGTGTTVVSYALLKTLNGLTSNTTYDCYIRTNCGPGGVSDWLGPVTFTTLCETTIYNISDTTCQGNIYMFGGQELIVSGNYSDTTLVSGCDSITNLSLVVNEPTENLMEEISCNSYYWDIDGNTYFTTGTYSFTTTNEANCDSVIMLDLIINYSTTYNITDTTCQGDLYMFGGQELIVSGNYSDTTLVGGCDSITNLSLVVNEPTENSIEEISCDSYFWDIDGNTYITTGTYSFTTTNEANCDSVITLDLIINYSTSSNETFNLTNINPSFTLSDGIVVDNVGIYSSISTNDDGCDHTTNYTIGYVGINYISNNIGVKIFPNPTTEILNIEFNEKLSSKNDIFITDILGQVVYNQANVNVTQLTINTSNLSNGAYSLKIVSDNKISVKPFTIN